MYRIDWNGGSMRVESFTWLSQLSLLRELDMTGIDLSAATENWLSSVNNLPILHTLWLDDCNLSLKLPSSLSYINSTTTLDTISLRNNKLNDTSIFEWLSNLGGIETSLVYLDLFSNQLFENEYQRTRYTMNFLGNLCSLQLLGFDNTSLKYDFSDIIQSVSVCSHKSLESLALAFNQVWGSIPDNISNLSYLRELYVGYNQLNGSISQALGGLLKLETLSLFSNSLKGVFTSAHLSNLSKLSDLDLEDNKELVVNISANWVPPFQLNQVFLSLCTVGPDFPMWLLTQNNLTTIGLSNTRISGKMPISFLSSLPSNLVSLSMSENTMYGVLPDVSITFEASPWIDLSSNNFSGAIPLFLRNVSVLQLNNNHFSKGLVPFLCPQTKTPVIYLNLSNNSFSDEISDCWSYFDKLLALHLENNNLWGNIPVSIGALNQLNFLHLSNNNLSGEIPVSLLNCTSLNILDLSHNSLSGYIPSGLGNIFKNLSILILLDKNFLVNKCSLAR